ncbi:MAG: hypothetical protein RIB45_04035 [Marivibrio sp.]|uniref:hypothetical protein n=1 Tax=Marivibrio sp. TaxID=2039719 RepID=UPI0032EEC3AF
MTKRTQDKAAIGRPTAGRAVRGGLALAAVGLLMLGGCRESEQNRPLDYEPGVYLGQQDEPLDEGVVDQLRDRARSGQQM